MFVWLRSSGVARRIGRKELRNSITYPNDVQTRPNVHQLDVVTCRFVPIFGTKIGFAQTVVLEIDVTIML